MPGNVRHQTLELLRQRVFRLACGYADCNDAARLADDAIHKLLVERDPIAGHQPSTPGRAQTAIELDRQLGQLDHLAVPLIVLGQIYQCRGDAPRALEYYAEALGLAEEAGEAQLLFPCYDGMATLHLDLGEPAEAERYLTLAQDLCARAGWTPTRSFCCRSSAELSTLH